MSRSPIKKVRPPKTKFRTGIYGVVDGVGYKYSQTGKSVELSAIIEVKLVNMRHGDDDIIERAEKRLEELKKMILGKKVEVYVVKK